MGQREALLFGDQERPRATKAVGKRVKRGMNRGVKQGVRKEALDQQQIKEIVEEVGELVKPAQVTHEMYMCACAALHCYTVLLSSLC